MGDNFQKSAFTKEYAKVYDKFHASKNYQAEIEGIINLLPKSSVDVLSFNVLDYGCGTGKFSNVLSERGWNVTGYDISTAMLDIARSQFSSIRFTNNLVKYESKFDLAFSLFDVLSYQTTMSDATLMIEQIRDTMKKNSPLVLDTWQKKVFFRIPLKTGRDQ
jgi:2-polyprenyl-3-methyl-5-hydroxy-6-metoxy-1,4-benzoquinol methylase